MDPSGACGARVAADGIRVPIAGTVRVMRIRLALFLAATAAALPLLSGPAHASPRDTCWEVAPTFYVAGLICRFVPYE